MTAYIVFFIVFGIICLISYIFIADKIEDFVEKLSYIKKEEEFNQFEKVAKWLNGKLHDSLPIARIFTIFFFTISFGSPFIYEFPRIYTVAETTEYTKRPLQPWMYIHNPDSGKFYKKKLPFLGCFQTPGHWTTTKKVHTGPVSVMRKFGVYEEKSGRNVKFHLLLSGNDWSEFLLELYNSDLNLSTLENDHEIIFKHLQKEFTNENIMFEEFPEIATKIGNEWLKKHNINSASISIDPPKRKVWFEK